MKCVNLWSYKMCIFRMYKMCKSSDQLCPTSIFSFASEILIKTWADKGTKFVITIQNFEEEYILNKIFKFSILSNITKNQMSVQRCTKSQQLITQAGSELCQGWILQILFLQGLRRAGFQNFRPLAFKLIHLRFFLKIAKLNSLLNFNFNLS